MIFAPKEHYHITRDMMFGHPPQRIAGIMDHRLPGKATHRPHDRGGYVEHTVSGEVLRG